MKIDVSNQFLYYPSKYQPDFSVLFHPFESAWLIVNETAKTMIKLIAKGNSNDTIAQYLIKNYDISYENALNDIHSVHETLSQNHFDISQGALPKQRTPSLKSLFIHVTKQCNLHCSHCYVASTDTPVILPLTTIISLIDTLVEQGGESLTISGGEPLLHPEIKKILSYASKKLTIRLLTNGTLIDKKMAAFLAEHNVYVQISLDGSTALIHDAIRGAGSYEHAVEAIQHLQEQGAGERLNLCTTLMEQNAADWHQMITLAEKNNIRLLRFLHLRKVGRAGSYQGATPLSGAAYEEFITHINQLQLNGNQQVELTCGMSGLLLKMPETFKMDDIWCPVGRMMVIDTNGDVYPCVLMMQDRYFLGNIHSQSLVDISQSRQITEICQLLSSRRFTIKKCLACSFRNLCQAGCMGQALDHFNNLNETDIFCRYRKCAYENAFDHLLKNKPLEKL